MKTLSIVGTIFAFMLATGCTHNDRDSAGLKRLPGAPPEQETRLPAPNGGQTGIHLESGANGGLGLPAAAPYSGAATASQTVNPGPFLTASQQAGNQSGPSTNPILTRSADGTMSGPNDLPAATTGWGANATDYSSPLALGKAEKKKPATPPQ